jgi:hypothetical protein
VLVCVPFLSGIAALVLGRLGLARADEMFGRGRRVAQAAIVLGMINLVLSFMVAAASFPAMGRARQRAREVQCASNLRQLSMAMFMYASGNKGSVPPDLDALLPFLGPTGAAAICTCPDAAAHRAPPGSGSSRKRASSDLHPVLVSQKPGVFEDRGSCFIRCP